MISFSALVAAVFVATLGGFAFGVGVGRALEYRRWWGNR